MWVSCLFWLPSTGLWRRAFGWLAYSLYICLNFEYNSFVFARSTIFYVRDRRTVVYLRRLFLWPFGQVALSLLGREWLGISLGSWLTRRKRLAFVVCFVLGVGLWLLTNWYFFGFPIQVFRKMAWSLAEAEFMWLLVGYLFALLLECGWMAWKQYYRWTLYFRTEASEVMVDIFEQVALGFMVASAIACLFFLALALFLQWWLFFKSAGVVLRHFFFPYTENPARTQAWRGFFVAWVKCVGWMEYPEGVRYLHENSPVGPQRLSNRVPSGLGDQVSETVYQAICGWGIGQELEKGPKKIPRLGNGEDQYWCGPCPLAYGNSSKVCDFRCGTVA